MTDTSVLQRMFNSKAKLSLEDKYGRKNVVLQEPKALDSKITIRCVPADAVVLDLDGSFSSRSLFEGSQGECKRADYLIISEEKQCVLFIEMKKTSSQEKDIIKQLKGSLCAFEYSQVIAREFFHENGFLNGYEKRFISINHTGLETRKTKIEKKAGIHNTPESLMKVSWASTIEFNRLAA